MVKYISDNIENESTKLIHIKENATFRKCRHRFPRRVNIIRWWVNTIFQVGKRSKYDSFEKHNAKWLFELNINWLSDEKLSILRVCKTLLTCNNMNAIK